MSMLANATVPSGFTTVCGSLKLRDAEDALHDIQAESRAMKESQSKSDPERDARLQAAIEETNKLKNALRRQQRAAEAEKEALEQEIKAQCSELERLSEQSRRRQARGNQTEAQNRDITDQLAEAQKANQEDFVKGLCAVPLLRTYQVDELFDSSLDDSNLPLGENQT
nr:uncharacterized protein LOC129278124 [Lytechinus pictus]